MTCHDASRPAPRRTTRTLVTALLVVIASITAASGHHVLVTSSSTAAPGIDLPRAGQRDAWGESGRVPDGVTVHDDAVPAVGNLDADLLRALRRAAEDAAGDGVDLHVTSGWRSPAYQEQLLQQAVAEHGSEEEAARWVATPETSLHVSGDAVDVGPSDAAEWLTEHGSEHGLCQIYRNEPWHFELRPDAVDQGCPPTYADPTQDPRLQP